MTAILYTPITYRGYMYDPFTGMYYLQSRYYNPSICRFLNVDDTDILEATQGTPLGANLFAYCNNNPVMNVDYSGNNPFVVIFFGFVLLVVVLIVMIAYCIIKRQDVDSAMDAYEKFEAVKSLYDLSSDLWLVFYTHAKNIIEYGTGVNPNPQLIYYDKFNYSISYTQLCESMYKKAIDWGVISSSDRWSSFDLDKKILVTRKIMGLDMKFTNRVKVYFAGALYTWGVDTNKLIIDTVTDMGIF